MDEVLKEEEVLDLLEMCMIEGYVIHVTEDTCYAYNEENGEYLKLIGIHCEC